VTGGCPIAPGSSKTVGEHPDPLPVQRTGRGGNQRLGDMTRTRAGRGLYRPVGAFGIVSPDMGKGRAARAAVTPVSCGRKGPDLGIVCPEYRVS
jgi:hypothetical protein